MDKLLSILIPVYNCEKTIARCFDSIVEQKGFNEHVDLLVINDGSTDKTESIIKQYMVKYDQIRLISRGNKGIGPTRNELLDNAIGQYFWFIDGDDYIEDDSLLNIQEKLKRGDIDMMIMGYRIIDEKGHETGCYMYSGEYDSGIDLTAKGFFNNSLWTRIYRLKKINHLGVRFNSFVMAEDFDFIFRLIPSTEKVFCIEDVIYNYVMTPHSATKEDSFSHRQKVAEDSLSCILNYGLYFNGFDKKTVNILKQPFNANLIAFLYSIATYSFPWEYKKSIIKKLNAVGFIPIKPLPTNKRRRLFSVMMNIPLLRFFLFTYLHKRQDEKNIKS